MLNNNLPNKLIRSWSRVEGRAQDMRVSQRRSRPMPQGRTRPFGKNERQPIGRRTCDLLRPFCRGRSQGGWSQGFDGGHQGEDPLRAVAVLTA